MPAITWGPQIQLGIEVIGSQHKRLVDLINELGQAMDDGRGPEVMARDARYTPSASLAGPESSGETSSTRSALRRIEACPSSTMSAVKSTASWISALRPRTRRLIERRRG